jgi:ankyrin repeat protein
MGTLKSAALLIRAKAAVDARDDYQRTALHYAAQEGHVKVCRMLMEAGAVVGAQTPQQNTPLHLAAAKGHVEVCRILMKASKSSGRCKESPAANTPSFRRYGWSR